MIQLTKAIIKNKVRRLLEETRLNESEAILDVDDPELDSLVEEKSLEALRFVHGNAESSLLNPSTVVSAAPSEDTGSVVHALSSIASPFDSGKSYTPVSVDMTDYLRLVSAYVDGWSRKVTDYSDLDSEDYAMQGRYYTMGTPERPKVFVDRMASSGGYFCLLYSASASNKTVTVKYMTEPVWSGTNTDELAVSDKLVDAFIYYLAGLVLMVRNDSHADDYFNQANIQMGVTAREGKADS